MLRKICLMACLLWVVPIMALSITEDGFVWDYDQVDNGLVITSVQVAPGSTIRLGKEVSIPETFPVDENSSEYLPVVAIREGAIGSDGGVNWKNVNKIILPKTLTTLKAYDEYFGSDKVNPLNASFFWIDSEEAKRETPLTLAVTGPVLNLYSEECWCSIYDEENGYYSYNSVGYFNLQLPEDKTYRAQWERMITDELIGLSVEEVVVIWRNLNVLDFKPNLNNRITEVVAALDAAQLMADDAGKNVLMALAKLIGLQQNAAIAKFATETGFVTITDGVWSTSKVTYEELEVQPAEVINLFLSESVSAELKGAIACLNNVPSTWAGQVTLEPSDILPLRETLVIDVADAFLLKASVQGFLSSLHLLSSYNLEWDYTKPIELPPLKMAQINDWSSEAAWETVQKNVAQDWYGDSWTVQVADCEGDLIFRLTPEDESTANDFAGVASAKFAYGYTDVENTEPFEYGAYQDQLTASDTSLFIIYEGCADKFDAAQAETECEYFYISAYSYDDNYNYYYDYYVSMEIVREIPLGTLFESQTGLLDGRVTTADLTAAKDYFKSAGEATKQAFDLLKLRSDMSEHLFNLSAEVTDEMMTTAVQYLDAVLDSLDEATEVTVNDVTDTLYLAPLFTQEGPEREHFPKIVDGKFVEESAIDSTYCGILPEHAAQTDGTWIVTKSMEGEWVITGHQLPETTTQVKLPATVTLADETMAVPTKVGYRLFAENKTLRKVMLPKDYSVGVETFKNCASLKELVFDTPQMLDIGDGAFDGVALTHLTAAALPEGISVDAIEKLRIATGTTSIPSCHPYGGYYYYYGDVLFGGSLPALKSLILPNTLAEINSIDFATWAPNLETVSFEGVPPTVGAYASFESSNAVGYYPSIYADNWTSEIVEGYWHGLKMETMKIEWNCTGGGSVTITAGATESGETSPGEELELKAVPEEGMVFVGWSGDIQGTENPIRTTVIENMSTTAHFLPKALYNALVGSSGGGLSGSELESYVEAVIKERGLISEDQVYSMNADVPLFKVEGGKVSIKLHMQTTPSLKTPWAPMDLLDADLVKTQDGELTITVPMKESENAAFYKFVVPDEQ